MPHRTFNIPRYWLRELLAHVSAWSLFITLYFMGAIEANCAAIFVTGVLCGRLLWPEPPGGAIIHVTNRPAGPGQPAVPVITPEGSDDDRRINPAP